jgi:hypothetical protein
MAFFESARGIIWDTINPTGLAQLMQVTRYDQPSFMAVFTQVMRCEDVFQAVGNPSAFP